ncbi:plasmid pRiA4b ORF-3 family protein [uncultured Friedmanniella sp.]|uniref:IS1096 element passenger TnpR family protein n=1 Tax=uncultured Friedmanniella sp. TaxID=335381 RepID=UPI0035C9E02D
MAGGTAEDHRALLQALLSGHVTSILDKLDAAAKPALRPPPPEVSGFRVRLDLQGAKPPVWRRLDLPGDLTLPRVHDAIQAAMGWTDSHLHRFRTGRDYRSPSFVTTFDVDEGEDGVPEDGVRLDQLVSAKGDTLWYEYDFGDGWDHVLQVEEVLDDRPATVRCVGGRMACPPEDCGGIGGYDELAAWVRSGYDDAQLPEVFGDAAQARDWLPLEWHPDHFAVDEANAALSVALAEPVAVTGELADLLEQLEQRGIRSLREVLGRPSSHEPTDVTDDEAARLTATYRTLLDLVGDGVALTSAGYLPPKLVEQLAKRVGITEWWIGKANREDLTPPVAAVRETARALGLVSVRKGRLAPTKAGVRTREDPQALLAHIAGRLPLGTKEFERHAGWAALAVAGSGVPAEQWREQVSDLLLAFGWRTDRDSYSRPPAHSPTLDVLEELAGAARTGWRVMGTDLAVAAAARSVIGQH